MSSPITAKQKGLIDRVLIDIHRRLSHRRRIDILARRITAVIRAGHPTGEIRCLDVGCGDMQLAERVSSLEPRTQWSCTDIHELPPDLQDSERWWKYRRFDGTHLPFPDRSFDVVLFCDVLHHVQTNASELLAEAGRAGRTVVIKDHFEYSLFSRLMLWGMDFLGNWGYGVALPKKYFTRERFNTLAGRAGLRIEKIDVGIELYGHLPLLRMFLRDRWHFIAVLKRS